MAAGKKRRKAERHALKEARRFTAGKLLRLVLKSVVFALVVSAVMLVLTVVGVPALDKLWIQLAVILAVYLVAFPFLLSEFRPKHYLPEGSKPKGES